MKGSFCRLMLACVCFVLTNAKSSAQVTTVPDFVQKKDSWLKMAQEEKRFQLDGRFESRAGDAFRLINVDMIFRLPATLKLPDRMERGQRLEISGHLAVEGTRSAFIVSRAFVRKTDVQTLQERVVELGEKDPQQLLALAQEYVDEANFYDDENLRVQIADVRTKAVTLLLRKPANTPATLKELLTLADTLKVDARLQEEICFNIVYQELRTPKPDFEASLEMVKTLPHWDRIVPPPSKTVVAAFPVNAPSTYANAGENDRSGFHRMAYSSLRTRQIQAALKADGSNGVELAKLVRSEFPEEKAIIQQLESKEVAWHLSRSDQLGRQELITVVNLLEGLERSQEAGELIQQWLKAQEKRFGTSTLAGILRTADEFLFAGEHWKLAQARTSGIELLKKAWTQAETESPDDVAVITERLKALGWERFKGQWMTTQQIGMVPQDDVELAIREGRVVRGMTGLQVQQTFGKPRQVSRIASARFMRELWVYEEAGLVIRLQRSLARPEEGLTVEDVSRTR